jgi:pimeloyl-ACP methyl ester carboxylesterase
VTNHDTEAWSPTAYAMTGEVRIAYDRLLASSGNPVLLVMGLGTSRFWWPLGLCQSLAAQGFEVARYDQRDAGESTRMPDTASKNPFAALARRTSGGYTAEDMADDAVAVMDALGWDRAHVFGHSMGGTLAQRIALRHPDRVRSVVSSAGVPSDASGLSVFGYLRFGLLAKLARAQFPEGREGDIEASLTVARGVASRTYPFDESAAREWIVRQVDSGPRDAKAQSRQIGAKWRGPKLRTMTVPALVLQGDEDPIVKVKAGRDTARRIPDATLNILRGAGHDLPEPLWEEIAHATRVSADRARP